MDESLDRLEVVKVVPSMHAMCPRQPTHRAAGSLSAIHRLASWGFINTCACRLHTTPPLPIAVLFLPSIISPNQPSKHQDILAGHSRLWLSICAVDLVIMSCLDSQVATPPTPDIKSWQPIANRSSTAPLLSLSIGITFMAYTEARGSPFYRHAIDIRLTRPR